MLPEYVLKYKQKGYKIKNINNHYYLYKVSSSRIPGMKYPQEKDIYIGVITEKGLTKPNITAKTFKAYEYGISMYLLKLSNEYINEYSSNVIVKAIISLMYGIHLFQYHYDNSYLSVIYPNIKIDYLKPVEKEVSRKILCKINNYEYGLLFGINAIKVNDKWVLTEVSEETKKIMIKYDIDMEII